MPTVAEILKSSGLTDEQIAALDSKATAAFTQVLSTADQTLEAAELAKRAYIQKYDEEIVPALNNWANEKTQYEAKMAAYEAALKGAKEGGFKVPDILAPTTTTPPTPGTRDARGQFVAGAPGSVPGSPTYMTREEGFRGMSSIQWVMAEHMRLNNGAPPPDDIEALANEAVQAHLPLKQYAEKKYGFVEKREKIKADAQKSHDDAIRKETEERVTKELTEKMGSNPMLRQGESSKFAVVREAVKKGERGDPLKMNRNQRSANTRQNIMHEIAENETVQ